MKKDETRNTGQQHEDAVLKLSAQAFATELLPYFNIKGRVLSRTGLFVRIRLYKRRGEFPQRI